MERHIALVQYDGLGVDLNKVKDKYVFHYTNIVGLRGILETRSIWASDHRFLNDVSEIRFGLQVLEMLIASARDILTQISPQLREEILMGAARLLEGRINNYILNVSFCRKGNLLSQWRAYGGRDGLAIAFDREFLELRATANGYITGAVYYYFTTDTAYSSPSSRQWVQRRANYLLEFLSALEIGAQNDFARGRRTQLIDRWLLETAAFLKHPAFSEEAEWRCVVVADINAFNGIEINDRTSGSRVIPYANFSLGITGDRSLGISRVVIGPNQDPIALEHAIFHMFRTRSIDIGSIIAPYSPLRL